MLSVNVKGDIKEINGLFVCFDGKIRRPCFFKVSVISFLIFFVCFGVLSVTTKPSSSYSPIILFPSFFWSCESRRDPTTSQVSNPS